MVGSSSSPFTIGNSSLAIPTRNCELSIMNKALTNTDLAHFPHVAVAFEDFLDAVLFEGGHALGNGIIPDFAHGRPALDKRLDRIRAHQEFMKPHPAAIA